MINMTSWEDFAAWAEVLALVSITVFGEKHNHKQQCQTIIMQKGFKHNKR